MLIFSMRLRDDAAAPLPRYDAYYASYAAAFI